MNLISISLLIGTAILISSFTDKISFSFSSFFNVKNSMIVVMASRLPNNNQSSAASSREETDRSLIREFSQIQNKDQFESFLHAGNADLLRAFWDKILPFHAKNASLRRFFHLLVEDDGERMSELLVTRHRRIQNPKFELNAKHLALLGELGGCSKAILTFFEIFFHSRNGRGAGSWTRIVDLIGCLKLGILNHQQLMRLFKEVTALAVRFADEFPKFCLFLNEMEEFVLQERKLELSEILDEFAKVSTSECKFAIWNALLPAFHAENAPFFSQKQFHAFWNEISSLKLHYKIQILQLFAEEETGQDLKVFQFFSRCHPTAMLNLLKWFVQADANSLASQEFLQIRLRKAVREEFIRKSPLEKNKLYFQSPVQLALKFNDCCFSGENALSFAFSLLLEESDQESVHRFVENLACNLSCVNDEEKESSSSSESKRISISKWAEFAKSNDFVVVDSLFAVVQASSKYSFEWYLGFAELRAKSSAFPDLYSRLDQGIKKYLKPFSMHSDYFPKNQFPSRTLKTANLNNQHFQKSPFDFSRLHSEDSWSRRSKPRIQETPPILLKNIEFNENFISNILNSRLTSIAMYLLVILLFILIHRANVAVKGWRKRRREPGGETVKTTSQSIIV